ncbi:oxygenase MpaB family protein [Quadrisphaera setariae]|uniref:oxygenase MpaB family protein n=1 Tax=Quadrisphaera setariae TaxID=2593304 RepID=UPI00164F6283|nr:oxygenase MpaB family protein [Quadrisphaera setariae]
MAAADQDPGGTRDAAGSPAGSAAGDFPTLLPPERVAEAEATYQRVVQEFTLEFRLANALAYLRTYASPRVAALLLHTGHVQHASTERAVDTALFVYELVHHGIDSEQGQEVVRRLNAMHGRWSIRNDDSLWVLGTFAVLGPQMIDALGWRRLTDDERQACVDWWREVGTRMGITGIPETHAEFADAFRAYELAHLRRTDAGRVLLEASWDVMVSDLPEPLRPVSRLLAAALTDEPARSALGLPRVGAPVRTALRLGLVTRGLLSPTRGRPVPGWFTPGAPLGPYPEGYSLADLGVGEHHRHPAVVRVVQEGRQVRARRPV